MRKPSIPSRLARGVFMLLYRWMGWRVEGSLPDSAKFVIAGAPHSSNWDFVFFVGGTTEMGVLPNFMGKNTLFKWPMRRFMYDMGGIPVDRSKRLNAAAQVAQEFERRERLALVIAPEGTRSSNGEWKSGFYHIAMAAGVPIVPAWADNDRRILGFEPAFMPSGNYADDLAKIAAILRARLPDEPRLKVLETQAARLQEEAE